MGFYIECVSGAELSINQSKVQIGSELIKEVSVGELLSSPRFKGDHEVRKAVFAADTDEGQVVWDVIFLMGDSDPIIEDVSLSVLPTGAEVTKHPEFKLVEADE